MKKLLGIVVLGLLLSGNAYANDIKIKRIECDNSLHEIRAYNFFIEISQNSKKAKIHRTFGNYGWNTVDYDLQLTLFHITFYKSGITLRKPKYEINRESGVLLDVDRNKDFGKSFKMEDDFSPETFLSDFTKKNVAKQKEKNKF